MNMEYNEADIDRNNVNDNRKQAELVLINYFLSYGIKAKEKAEKFNFNNFDSSELFIDKYNKLIFNGILKAWFLGKLPNPLNVYHYIEISERNNNLLHQYDKKIIEGIIADSFTYQSRMFEIDTLFYYIIEMFLRDYWKFSLQELKNNQYVIEDVFEYSDNLIQGYQTLIENYVTPLQDNQGSKSLREIEEENRQKALSGEVINPPIFLKSINDKTGGYINGELTIMAGRPGMGKTSVALMQSRYLSITKGFKVIFFSLEMLRIKVINKIVSWETGIPYYKFRDRNYSDLEAELIYQWYDYFDHPDCPLKIYNNTDLNFIKNKISEEKPDFVVIDYLQLITTKKKTNTREQEVSHISRMIKKMTLKEKIPILALSQLSRSVENRTNKRPILSDLRESGSIEQDADCVTFLYRDAYYRNLVNAYVAPHELFNIEWIEAKNRMSGIFNEYVNIDFITGEYQDGFKDFS